MVQHPPRTQRLTKSGKVVRFGREKKGQTPQLQYTGLLPPRRIPGLEEAEGGGEGGGGGEMQAMYNSKFLSPLPPPKVVVTGRADRYLFSRG